jgi:hypothetical protein
MKQEKGEGVEALYDQLFMSRVVARNLRFLLRNGDCACALTIVKAPETIGRFDQVSTLFERGSRRRDSLV